MPRANQSHTAWQPAFGRATSARPIASPPKCGWDGLDQLLQRLRRGAAVRRLQTVRLGPGDGTRGFGTVYGNESGGGWSLSNPSAFTASWSEIYLFALGQQADQVLDKSLRLALGDLAAPGRHIKGCRGFLRVHDGDFPLPVEDPLLQFVLGVALGYKLEAGHLLSGLGVGVGDATHSVGAMTTGATILLIDSLATLNRADRAGNLQEPNHVGVGQREQEFSQCAGLLFGKVELRHQRAWGDRLRVPEMRDDPSRVMTFGHFVQRGADIASLPTHAVAAETTFFLEQPAARRRTGDGFHGYMVRAQWFSGEAEHIQREGIQIVLTGFDGRHRRAGRDRRRVLEVAQQPFGAAVGAYLVQFRPDHAAGAMKLMAADAAGLLKHVVTLRQLRRVRHVGREMAFAAGGLNVFHVQHWPVPVLDVTVSGLTGRGASLALVADGAAKLVERMPVVIGMIGQRDMSFLE